MNHKIISNGKERILKFDCENCEEEPNIAKNPSCMKEVNLRLEENAKISSLILAGKYIKEYKNEDLEFLKEFSQTIELSKYLIQRQITLNECTDCENERKNRIEKIWSRLKGCPPKGLDDLKQFRHEISEKLSQGSDECQECREAFLRNGIEPALQNLSETKLIKEPDFSGNNNENFEDLFNPAIRPCFLRSKISFKPPSNAELEDAYEVQGSEIRIYYSPERLEYLYFIIPPEYKLPPKQVDILLKVREKLLENEKSLDPDLAKEQIQNQSQKLIAKTALKKNIDLEQERIRMLSKILTKYTAGFGLIETLLSDRKIQDIYVDAPVGENPIYIHHQDYEECFTNASLTPEDAKILTSRFRAISGRPFSESAPSLDLEWENIRVAAIKNPLSPEGLALAIRRHKSTPWTLPLFVEKNFITPEAAGLLSLIVDSQASILVTGSRGAGKTSLLGALLLELLPKYRILCLEDTAELPVEKLRSLGYKSQRLQVRSSGSDSEIEMSTEDALRTALRLGESVLAIGEVRGPETRALYEAMRVGAAGNSVMGTIHGSSTKDVFERVVYDLGIPPSSFKATDVITVASPIRDKGSINRVRRLVQISEVGSSWKDDPISEDGFTDLMSYDPDEDKIKTTTALDNGDSELVQMIAKKWSTNTSKILKNFKTRSRICETLVERARSENSDLLEAEFVVKSNMEFHRLLEKEINSGKIDFERLYLDWKDWLDEVS